MPGFHCQLHFKCKSYICCIKGHCHQYIHDHSATVNYFSHMQICVWIKLIRLSYFQRGFFCFKDSERSKFRVFSAVINNCKEADLNATCSIIVACQFPFLKNEMEKSLKLYITVERWLSTAVYHLWGFQHWTLPSSILTELLKWKL